MIQFFAGGLGIPNPASTAGVGVFDPLTTHTRRIAVAVERLDVRDVNSHLALDAPPLRIQLVGPGVANAQVNTLDDDTLFVGEDFQDFPDVAFLPVVPAEPPSPITPLTLSSSNAARIT